MTNDEILLAIHQENLEQSKCLGQIQSDIRSLNESTQVKFQIVNATIEDHKVVCKRKWKINNHLWMVLVCVSVVVTAFYFNIPILKGVGFSALAGAGGWTIKEWLGDS